MTESLVEETVGQLVLLFHDGIVEVGKGLEREFAGCLADVDDRLRIILHALEMLCRQGRRIELCQQVVEIAGELSVENRRIGALHGLGAPPFLLEECHMLGKQRGILAVDAVLVEQAQKLFVEEFVVLSPYWGRNVFQRHVLTNAVEHILPAPDRFGGQEADGRHLLLVDELTVMLAVVFPQITEQRTGLFLGHAPFKDTTKCRLLIVERQGFLT